MRHNIFSRISAYLLLMLAVLGFVACSSSDDDYEPAAALSASNQQVHFAGDNNETVILDPSNKSTYKIAVKVIRNTKQGALTVPVVKNSNTTAGVTVDDNAVFADGDSVATITVSIPDTATVPQAFTYSLSLKSDEVDPYSYLDGGITLDARASIPAPVKIDFWIPNYFEQKWVETADDLGGGVYRIKNFMHSGYGLVLTIKDGKLSLSLPSGSPLYTEDDWGGYGYGYPAIYWYTNDNYVHLYPYGKDGGVDILDFEILPTYNCQWYAARNSGAFYLGYIQTADGTVAAYWAPVYFHFE
jgi:hypothetical protein